MHENRLHSEIEIPTLNETSYYHCNMYCRTIVMLCFVICGISIVQFDCEISSARVCRIFS